MTDSDAVTGDTYRAYRRRYHDFVYAVQASRVISLVAHEALKDFPKSLPQEARDSVNGFMVDVAKALLALTKGGEETTPQSVKRPRRRTITIKSRGQLAATTLQLRLAQFLSGGDVRHPGDIDFPYRLRAQELVMLLAHLDAFFGDTLRAVCLHNPAVLRRSKTLTWKDILSCGSWDAVVTRLVEAQAYDFGWKSTRDKVQSLEKELGLRVRYQPEDLQTIDDAEQARHVIVHNNCRVSHEYIWRTGQPNIAVGATIRLPQEFVDAAANAVTWLASDLFLVVAKKFFGAKPGDLTGVYRRAKRELGGGSKRLTLHSS